MMNMTMIIDNGDLGSSACVFEIEKNDSTGLWNETAKIIASNGKK